MQLGRSRAEGSIVHATGNEPSKFFHNFWFCEFVCLEFPLSSESGTVEAGSESIDSGVEWGGWVGERTSEGGELGEDEDEEDG